MLRPQALFAAALLFVIGLAVQLPAAADPPQVIRPDWIGTIEVTREGEKVYPQIHGPDTSMHIQVSQRIVFTLAGDGTASYVVTHDETRVETAPMPMGTVTTMVHGQASGPSQAYAEFYEGSRMSRKTMGIARTWAVAFDTIELPVTVDTRGRFVANTEESRFYIDASALFVDADPTVRTLAHTLTRELGMANAYYYFRMPLDATETIVVNLTRVPGSDKTGAELTGDAEDAAPRVSILGPSCGCIDPQDPQAPLSYTASASHAGGMFTAFEIDAAGQAPVVLTNRGGQYARLELDGQGNGIAAPVTLRIGYRYQGQDYLAAPYRVDACAYEQAATTSASIDEPTLEEAMADMAEGLAVLAQANEAFKRGDLEALAGIDMERMEQLGQGAERRGDLMTGGDFGARGCALQVDATDD